MSNLSLRTFNKQEQLDTHNMSVPISDSHPQKCSRSSACSRKSGPTACVIVPCDSSQKYASSLVRALELRSLALLDDPTLQQSMFSSIERRFASKTAASHNSLDAIYVALHLPLDSHEEEAVQALQPRAQHGVVDRGGVRLDTRDKQQVGVPLGLVAHQQPAAEQQHIHHAGDGVGNSCSRSAERLKAAQ